jgi:hypothetical protein
MLITVWLANSTPGGAILSTASSPPRRTRITSAIFPPSRTGPVVSDQATQTRSTILGSASIHACPSVPPPFSMPRRTSSVITGEVCQTVADTDHRNLRHFERMAQWRRITVRGSFIGTAFVLSVLAAGFLANRPQQAPARAATTAAIHATVTINEKLGEAFAPAPPSAAAALTAQQAWLRYARHVGSDRHHHAVRRHRPAWPLHAASGPANLPGTGSLPKSHGEAYIALNKQM